MSFLLPRLLESSMSYSLSPWKCGFWNFWILWLETVSTVGTSGFFVMSFYFDVMISLSSFLLPYLGDCDLGTFHFSWWKFVEFFLVIFDSVVGSVSLCFWEFVVILEVLGKVIFLTFDFYVLLPSSTFGTFHVIFPFLLEMVILELLNFVVETVSTVGSSGFLWFHFIVISWFPFLPSYSPTLVLVTLELFIFPDGNLLIYPWSFFIRLWGLCLSVFGGWSYYWKFWEWTFS